MTHVAHFAQPADRDTLQELEIPNELKERRLGIVAPVQDAHPTGAMADGSSTIFPSGVDAATQHRVLSIIAAAQVLADKTVGRKSRAADMSAWHAAYIGELNRRGWPMTVDTAQAASQVYQNAEFHRVLLDLVIANGFAGTAMETLLTDFLKRLVGNAGSDGMLSFLIWDRGEEQMVTATFNVLSGAPEALRLDVVQIRSTYEYLRSTFLGLLKYRWDRLAIQMVRTQLVVNSAPDIVAPDRPLNFAPAGPAVHPVQFAL